MLEPGLLTGALAEFLPAQRWWGSKGRGLDELIVYPVEVLKGDLPALLRVEASAFGAENVDRYQILVGLRMAGDKESLRNIPDSAVIGDFQTKFGVCTAYDALLDPELSRALYDLAAPANLAPCKTIHPIGADQSNTSLVCDESVVFKVFRKLSDGPNLEVETIGGLRDVRFPHVAEVLGEWRHGGRHLGFFQKYLTDGVEGRSLAMTSLRDFYRSKGDPSMAGGDFSPEAERLGAMTAELHLALGRAFGKSDADPDAWADSMLAQLGRVSHPDLNAAAAAAVFSELRRLGQAGSAVRVHGDFHLGQVLRTDAGWYVFDFEGEPARAIEERKIPTSPLKDVAGMLRSFQYAAWLASDYQTSQPKVLARAWVDRNRQAFLNGYVAVAHGAGGLLPSSTAAFETVLRAFEIDKAVYEVGYEMAHRPELVKIPLAGLGDLLSL